MNRLENKIREKFEDFQVAPPENLWENIENRLDNKRPVYYTFYRYKKIAAAAAAIVVLVISATFIFLNTIFNNSSPQYTGQTEQTGYEPQTIQPTTPTQEESLALHPDVYPENESVPAMSNQSENQNVSVAATSYSHISSTIHRSQNTFSDYSADDKSTHKVRKDHGRLMVAQGTRQAKLFTFSKPTIIIGDRFINITNQIFNPLAPTSENQIIALATDKSHPGRLSLSAYFAPQQSYRYQASNTPNPTQSLESEIITYNAGIHLTYKINNRWQLQTGMGYNRLGQIINDIASFSHPSLMPLYSSDGSPISEHPQSMGTSMGGILFTDQSFYFADISSTRIITLKGSYDERNINLLNKSSMGLIQYFEYLELPLNVRYKIIDKGISLFVKSGITASYLLSGEVFLQGKSRDKPIGKTVGINSLNLMGSGGLVLSYPLTNRINVSLEPTASFFITPIGNVRNLTRNTYPYSFAVFMGLSYDL